MDLTSLPLQERVAAATKALRVVHDELVLAQAKLDRARSAELPTIPRPSLLREVSADWLKKAAADEQRAAVDASERNLARLLRLWEHTMSNACSVWGSDAAEAAAIALGPTS